MILNINFRHVDADAWKFHVMTCVKSQGWWTYL